MIQLGPQIGWPSQLECNTAHVRARMLSTIVNTVVAEAPLWYRSSEVNKSITKAIIDRNAPQWFTTNLMFSQKPKLIRSVASDGLTNIYKRWVSLNIYKQGVNKFGRKIGFKIENESEDHNKSSPKLVGILTVLRCIFGPNFVILAWMADE